MTTLGIVGPSPHGTIFQQTRGLDPPGPLKVSSNTGSSILPYQDTFRLPYLPSPMSGSPSPESRSEPVRGTRYHRRSCSTETVAAALPSTEPAGRAGGNPISTINLVLNHEPIHPEHYPTSVSATAATVAISTSTQEEPGLVSTSIQARTEPLPPRLTRRAKAHVASACVNCKQKHLGCDSARPCRRCVLAGKEASCVDVVHKRRGRPPLKAEESTLRTSDSIFGRQTTPREPHQPQSSPRQNASVSREIRPLTKLSSSSYVDMSDFRRQSLGSDTLTRSATPGLASMLPPSSAVPTTPQSSNLSRYYHSPGKGSPRRQTTCTFGSGAGPFEPTRRLSDSSPYLGQRFSAENFPSSPRPHSYHREPSYPSLVQPHAALQTNQAQPAASGRPGAGFTLPSISEFQLPPIRTPITSGGEHSSRFPPTTLPLPPPPPPSQNFTPPIEPQGAQRLRSESVGKLDNSPFSHPQSYFQGRSPEGGREKRMSHPQLTTGTSLSSSPRMGTETQSVATSDSTRGSSLRPSSVHARTEEREGEAAENGRRIKRRKMELGEIVNE